MYVLNNNKNIVNMKLIDRMRNEQIVIFEHYDIRYFYSHI